MSFKYKGSLLANTGPTLQTVIIDNSDTIYLDSVVKCRNGNLEVTAAGDAVGGIVQDLVDKNGNSIFGSLASVGTATVVGTAGSSAAYVTVAGTNETVDQIAAVIDISPYSVYSASVTGTPGTTIAAKPGGWFDVNVSSSIFTIEETTGTRTIGTGGQFVTVPSRNPSNGCLDDDDTTRMLVKISESEFFSSKAGA